MWEYFSTKNDKTQVGNHVINSIDIYELVIEWMIYLTPTNVSSR